VFPLFELHLSVLFEFRVNEAQVKRCSMDNGKTSVALLGGAGEPAQSEGTDGSDGLAKWLKRQGGKH
jgi:hypothetical protein